MPYHNGMQGACLSPIHHRMKRKQRKQPQNIKQCQEHSHTGAVRKGEKCSQKYHTSLLLVCLAFTHAQLSLQGTGEAESYKQPHLVGMTAGLHNLIWQTEGDPEIMFSLKHVQNSNSHPKKTLIFEFDLFNTQTTATVTWSACKQCSK